MPREKNVECNFVVAANQEGSIRAEPGRTQIKICIVMGWQDLSFLVQIKFSSWPRLALNMGS